MYCVPRSPTWSDHGVTESTALSNHCVAESVRGRISAWPDLLRGQMYRVTKSSAWSDHCVAESTAR